MSDSDEREIRRLAVIGTGTMGETLISGLVDAGVVEPAQIVATAAHAKRLEVVAETLGVEATLDNRAAVDQADVVLLCVKPQMAQVVLSELAPALGAGQLLISIVAGLTTGKIEAALEAEVPVVRAMPNTPSRIGVGMTAVCGGRWATAEHLDLSRAVFDSVGRCLAIEERYLDAVTGLSGSGPAFIYMVIEALAEGGVKCGLPRAVATELAAQTCRGAAQMVLETGHHPALLKDEVTTPAGCTMDGILTLEEGGLRVTLIKAIVEASRRAQELVAD